MSQVFVGTAYHQVYCVPLDQKAPILKWGEKKKSTVTSIFIPPYGQSGGKMEEIDDPEGCVNPAQVVYYSDERQSFEIDRDENNEEPSIPTCPSILGEKQKIISYEIFNQKHIYYTSHGNIYFPKQQQNEETQWSKLYYNEIYDNVLKSLPKQRAGRQLPEYTTVSVYNRNNNIQVAFGGRGVLPFVYEANQNLTSITWRAKNVTNDELDLQVPQNDIGLCFTNFGCSLIAANAENKVRIYDVKSRRRKPVTDIILSQFVKVDKTNLTKMAKSSCENYLYLGNHKGSIFEVDLRKNLGVTGKFKGITTTIKDIQVDNHNLAVVSLDGYLRIFNTLTKQIEFERYLNTNPEVLKLSEQGIVYPQEPAFNVQEIDLHEDREEGHLNPPKVKKIRKRNKVGLKYLEPRSFDDVKIEENNEQDATKKETFLKQYEDEDLDL